jgi:hypothetical protein
MNALATAPAEAEIDERLDDQLTEFACAHDDSREVDSQFGTDVIAQDVQRGAQDSAQDAVQNNVRHDEQSENKARRWMWGFLIALGALQIYYVQEMLAALFLFTLAFAVFAVIALAIYAANRASQASLARVEPIARVAARAGRRGYGFVEYLSKKPFRHPHSETGR